MIEIKGLSKSFGKKTVVEDVTLKIQLESHYVLYWA